MRHLITQCGSGHKKTALGQFLTGKSVLLSEFQQTDLMEDGNTRKVGELSVGTWSWDIQVW